MKVEEGSAGGAKPSKFAINRNKAANGFKNKKGSTSSSKSNEESIIAPIEDAAMEIDEQKIDTK